MTTHTINVSIVYALPERIWQQSLRMNRGAVPEELMQQTGLFVEFPELLSSFNAQQLNYGVFSKRVDENYLLEEGDRLEIYRELTADPKTVRRELAKQGKTMSGRDSGNE